MNLSDIATDVKPARASSLVGLMRCPLNWVRLQLSLDKDESGQAADTGSAVHEAARCFHQEGKGDTIAALKAMRAALNRFPFADLDRAEEMFLPYARDARNRWDVCEAVERFVTIRYAPHPSDKTQKEVVIQGTLDQLRRMDGVLSLLDIKTGSPDGPEMVNQYAYQLAAYMVAASELGEPVRKAFVIRTRDYVKRTKTIGQVFYPASFTLRDARVMMHSVIRQIARVRNGEFDPIPGDHCRYCPQLCLGNCVPSLVQIGV